MRRTIPLALVDYGERTCGTDCRERSIRSSAFGKRVLAEGAAEAISLLAAGGRNFRFDEGESIEPDSGGKTVIMIAGGVVGLFRMAPDGRLILQEILESGMFLTLPEDAGPALTAGDNHRVPPLRDPVLFKTMTAVCLVHISIPDLQRQSSTWKTFTMCLDSQRETRLRHVRDLHFIISSRTVEQRVAWMLLSMAQRFGSDSRWGLLLQVPLGREDIAAYIAATAESVSRIMSRFQRETWIITGRRWVAVKDPEALYAVINGCPYEAED